MPLPDEPQFSRRLAILTIICGCILMLGTVFARTKDDMSNCGEECGFVILEQIALVGGVACPGLLLLMLGVFQWYVPEDDLYSVLNGCAFILSLSGIFYTLFIVGAVLM